MFTKSAKRLFDEINYAQQRGDYSAERGFKPWLKRNLQLAIVLNPDNMTLKTMTKLTNPQGYFDNPLYASANLTAIKMQLLEIMDALDLDLR